MLRVDGVTVRFDGAAALDDASLDVTSGETVTVLGPSGSGKTTLLRVVAGLQVPDEGRVVLDEKDLAGVAPHRRGIGLVFQDHALFPHRNVAENVGFGLRMRGDDPAATTRRVGELLELVGLAGFYRRSVGTLSGGEQQRVALARALAPEPRLLLLDEPLGSLDRRLRDRLLDDLARLFGELDLTAVYVTHDHTEAFTLGDRVAVMRHGRVVQVATPDELWARPVDADVARFLGQSVRDGTSIRPESVTVTAAQDGATGNGTVESATRVGPTVRLVLRLDDGSTLEAAMTALDHPQPGDRVVVTIDPDGVAPLAKEPEQ
jgi:thiamine transport system ATP-binding protein